MILIVGFCFDVHNAKKWRDKEEDIPGAAAGAENGDRWSHIHTNMYVVNNQALLGFDHIRLRYGWSCNVDVLACTHISMHAWLSAHLWIPTLLDHRIT